MSSYGLVFVASLLLKGRRGHCHHVALVTAVEMLERSATGVEVGNSCFSFSALQRVSPLHRDPNKTS